MSIESSVLLANTIHHFIEEERVPYKEGWRKVDREITQKDMFHLIFSLVEANHHKIEEAELVGLGTMHAVNNALKSLIPTTCNIM